MSNNKKYAWIVDGKCIGYSNTKNPTALKQKYISAAVKEIKRPKGCFRYNSKVPAFIINACSDIIFTNHSASTYISSFRARYMCFNKLILEPVDISLKTKDFCELQHDKIIKEIDNIPLTYLQHKGIKGIKEACERINTIKQSLNVVETIILTVN